MRLVCLGDIAISGTLPTPWPDPFRSNEVDAEKVLFNWELSVGKTINMEPRSRGPRLLSDPNSIYIIQNWAPGFATMATNHLLDAGIEGVLATKTRLSQAGFQTVGVGFSKEEKSQPLIWKTDQGQLAIVNWVFPETHPDWQAIPGPNCWPGVELANQELRELKEKVDWILVSPHWGDECFPYPAPKDREIARGMIEAGADLIIGHHPHVVRGMEMIQGKPVFYSLGNFYFSESQDQQGRVVIRPVPRNKEALVVKVTFERGQSPEIQALSYWQRSDKTEPDPYQRALRRLRRTSRLLVKLSGDDYDSWYQKRRSFFDKWEYRLYFSFWQLGLKGTIRYLSTPLIGKRRNSRSDRTKR